MQHLVDTDSVGFVLVSFLDEVFINPKLCCCDGFSLWDTRKVKPKFSSGLLVQGSLIMIGYYIDKNRERKIGVNL